MSDDAALVSRRSMTRAQTLRSRYVAQPVGGAERNGVKWELNRVYDPAGRLDRDQTYWEVRQVLADDPAPRSVAYAEVAPTGIAFSDFSRVTTSLEQVERWIADRRKMSDERIRMAAAAAHPARRHMWRQWPRTNAQPAGTRRQA
jgi:hypothetical protein